MQPLVRLENITHTFWQKSGVWGKKHPIHAVQELGLSLYPGKTLGLVGESGCGKSTLARVAVGLLPPAQGQVFFRDTALYADSSKQDAATRLELRRNIQMVFQDPYSSLNPRMRVGESVGEPLLCAYPAMNSRERKEAVAVMLQQVGLKAEDITKYPHEFSGGQRQRIAIARALLTSPAFVVCDEPTSSLDTSVQAQVLNLLTEMQEKTGTAFLFISHDLAVVRHTSDVVAVMYAGRIVEEARVDVLFAVPRHPYTRLLLDSLPAPLAGGLPLGQEQEPALIHPLPRQGCAFAPRCPRCTAQCVQEFPLLGPVAGTDPDASDFVVHKARCFHPFNPE